MKSLSWAGIQNGRFLSIAGALTAVLLLGITVPAVQAQQVGTSISIDGVLPNTNAMLDVQSPAAGDGKGFLMPRLTTVQRTTANATVSGGLLDNSGQLRGGAAHGLLVFQTDGNQGIYYNTSTNPTPSWSYLGDNTAAISQLQGDVSFISNNYVKVEPPARTFGMTAVAQNGNGTVFTHPTTNMVLTWTYAGAQTSGVLTVSNDCWFWLDASITMHSQNAGSAMLGRANDLNIMSAISLTNHAYSGGWTATAVKEDATGPGFRFEGCQYANGINGIVIYWH